MDNDARYIPVAQTLPAVLPPLTRKAAMRYADRIVRKFGRLGLGSPNQTRPASWSTWRIYEGRRCWAATKPTAGHLKGWGRMIHDASHLVFQARHPSFRPHDGGHAALEREIAEYVVRKGWLAPRAKIRHQKPNSYERAKANLPRWETKLKRATNAIKKLRRTIARHERGLQR